MNGRNQRIKIGKYIFDGKSPVYPLNRDAIGKRKILAKKREVKSTSDTRGETFEYEMYPTLQLLQASKPFNYSSYKNVVN